MLKYLLALIFACVFSMCVYAHNQDRHTFDRSVYHGHPKQDCYGKIWKDCFQSGWIMKNHADIDPVEIARLNGGVTGIKDYHEHPLVARMNENQKRKRSHEYYDKHRYYYCNGYKDGGPKPSQRHFHGDDPNLPEPIPRICEVVEAPSAPKLIKASTKLAITWASLKKSRI